MEFSDGLYGLGPLRERQSTLVQRPFPLKAFEEESDNSESKCLQKHDPNTLRFVMVSAINIRFLSQADVRSSPPHHKMGFASLQGMDEVSAGFQSRIKMASDLITIFFSFETSHRFMSSEELHRSR